MRPKDLPILFSWEERKPLLHDGMLCVPRYYEEHEKFSFSAAEVFGNTNPLCIEFCSGNGEWIARAASLYPDHNWIGVEKQFKRTRKIWSKKQNLSLKNLLPVCGMAEDFCLHYLKGGRVAKAFVNFPDPWPKNGHAKNRIIQSPFIHKLTSVCSPGAELTLVTDDIKYSLQMKKVLASHPKWHLLEDAEIPENYGSSYFNRLWESMNKNIQYMRYQLDSH
ncbi:MAG: tRNA (guanosine(46)-N7)-methyltransferase TrmB [Chlamydiae bacterium]|nr:tRNA (guanosine(46)-N7)-methyltransferase TrmB [Chlamydiota bacterium]